jgi:replicative DNA helicase
MKKGKEVKLSDRIKTRVNLTEYVGRYGEIRNGMMTCPLPGHEDTEPSFSIDGDKGLWNCLGCNRGGSIIDFVMHMKSLKLGEALISLADEFNIPADERFSTNGNLAPKPEKKPRQKYSGIEAYSQEKFRLPQTVFTAHGCIERDGWMLIPARDGIFRMRDLSGNPNRPKYKPERGGNKAQWFLLDKALKLADKINTKILVLCNGQTSSMVAQHYGIPAFCKTDGENIVPDHLLPELVLLLADGWKLWIALDCDDHGKGHKVAGEIIVQLNQYNPVFIDLKGKGGYDLGDFCVVHKSRSWERLPGMAGVSPTPLVTIATEGIERSLRELANQDVEKPETSKAQIIEKLEARIQILRDAERIAENGAERVTRDVFDQWQAAIESPQMIVGLRTGLTKQDYAIGGLQDGAVYTWMGATGSGKTTLVMSEGVELLEQCPGLICVGEAGKQDIVRRLVGHLAHVPWKSLKTGRIRQTGLSGNIEYVPFTEQQKDKISDSFKKVNIWEKEHVLNFRDSSTPLTTTALKTQIPHLVTDYGVSWAIIDSVDNIPTAGAKSEYDKISQAMFAFERIAVDNNIPVLSTSQIGRATKERKDKRPKLNDGLSSNHIEGKSFALMAIYNHWVLVDKQEIEEQDGDDLRYPKGTAMITVKKIRDGQVGDFFHCQFAGGIGWYNYDKAKRDNS